MSASTKYLICFVGLRDPRPSFGIAGPSGEPEDGPVLALINHQHFDEVFLLFSADVYLERATQIRLECDAQAGLPKVNLISVDIPNVIDHTGIFHALNTATAALMSRQGHRKPHWSVLLDPGTPQMQTAWILLVRSGAFPATLIQGVPPKFNNGVYTCREVDLSDEALPTIIPPGQASGNQPDYETKSTEKKTSKSPDQIDAFEQAIEDSQLVIRDGPVRKLFHQAWLVAQHDHVHHLILGETGTGKSRLAEWIHKSGPRREQPMYSVNCATLTNETAASALFGHKKGAYTGAESDRPGAIRSANGGVLFLDEIGELTPELQARLLHVLDGQSFLPLGSDEPVTADVVIIAATNRDLMEMVNKGTFRQDLYGRLATVPLTMPPLRDRPGDLDLLIESRLADWNRAKKTEKSLSGETLAILRRYNWPRNIRELENTLTRICMIGQESLLVPEDLPAEILKAAGPEYISRLPSYELPPGGVKLRELLADFEKDVFRQAIERSGGVMSQAAILVGWNGPAFRKAVKERYPELDPDSWDVLR